MGPRRQNVMVLYLANSALDSRVVSWARWDGTGRTDHVPGGDEEPPYDTGLDALRDGWRLIQMSPLLPHASGAEFTTSYLKYEFVFEQLAEADQ